MGSTRRVVGRASAGAAALAALAACGPAGGGGSEGAPKAGGSGKQVTLRVGARAAAVSGNPSWDEFQAGKQLFESRYPKITLEITPDMNSEKFLAAAAAGDAWDVQDLCCDQVPVEARAGVLMKLDPFIKKGLKEADVKDWIEWQYKYFNIDGAQHAIGKYMGCTALYFNKDWFGQKGVALPTDAWTWNDYRDAALKLSDPANKKFGFNLMTRVNGVGQPMGADRRQAKVHQNGGTFVDSKNDLKSALDTPKTIEALEWLRDRIWKDHASPQPSELPGYPDQILNTRLQFTQGHVATWEDGSWSLVPVLQDKPSFAWDVVTLPKGPVQRDVLATTDAWAMWAQTKSVDDAWLLYSWFNGDDWYGIQSKRLQPARLSWLPKWKTLIVEANPDLQGKNLNAFTLGPEQGFARPWELHRFHAAVNPLINDETDAAVTRNEKPVRDTMLELARQVNEIQQKELAASGKS
jgi:ABC-type glycerol-3-phosphate transport system substrate-binding protein